jgi:hypothetical protein
MPSVRAPDSFTVPPVSTYREEVAQRIALLVAPIAGANPAGADVSYDADFETIKIPPGARSRISAPRSSRRRGRTFALLRG